LYVFYFFFAPHFLGSHRNTTGVCFLRTCTWCEFGAQTYLSHLDGKEMAGTLNVSI